MPSVSGGFTPPQSFGGGYGVQAGGGGTGYNPALQQQGGGWGGYLAQPTGGYGAEDLYGIGGGALGGAAYQPGQDLWGIGAGAMAGANDAGWSGTGGNWGGGYTEQDLWDTW
jgi:hypothetical protein